MGLKHRILELMGYIRKEPFDSMKIKKESKIYKIGGGWGNHIHWTDAGNRVYGHMTTPPETGDYVTCETVSGKICLYRFKNIEYCMNPTDMFFADTIPICYEDDIEWI